MHAFDTPRLHMRPLAEGDETLYCRLYTDPVLMRHIAMPMSLEAAQRSFRAACRQQSPHVQRWIIVERLAGKHIGLLGLFVDSDAAEIGVMLFAGWQGKGYAAEAISAMADRVFAAGDVLMLWTRHAPGNELATGLMHKLGFRCEVPHAPDQAELRWRMPREHWRSCRRNPAGVAMPDAER